MINALITSFPSSSPSGLVVIHELGHYLVGAARGRQDPAFLHRLRARPLDAPPRRGQDRMGGLRGPAGGYVKMLDEREGPVAASEVGRAFNRQGVGARILIVLAGPAANFLLALLLYWGSSSPAARE
jgi:regulator of sigma E protease